MRASFRVGRPLRHPTGSWNEFSIHCRKPQAAIGLVRWRTTTSTPTVVSPSSSADTSMCAEEPVPQQGPAPFDELDVRVGKILEVWEHPDSDKLWCERIDVGEAAPREVASGLRGYYPRADLMIGRSVLVVCNLKPAKLAGFVSNGMVLCASSLDRSTVAFVEPPEGSAPGERVHCQGSVTVPAASANRVKKKKLMEAAAKELRAINSIATYRGVPLCTTVGTCSSPSIADGSIH